MRRIVLPIGFGIIGCAILLALGFWQVQRLGWKQGILAQIDARISAAPVPLPDRPERTRDQYLAVTASGVLAPGMVRILVSQKGLGAGYRIISPFKVGARHVLLDRGILPAEAGVPAPPEGTVQVVGNLLWPDEIDSFTPDPDLNANIWFARDLADLSSALGTEPVLIVLRESAFEDAPVQPLPVGGAGIPNDHLGYAITWFSLAAIWVGMTGYFLWRMRRQTSEG